MTLMPEDSSDILENPPMEPERKKGVCPHCGDPISGSGGLQKHLKAAHPEILKLQLEKMNLAKAKASTIAPENKEKPPKAAASRTTADYRQANVFAYVPKKFEFSSTLLTLAKQVSMEVWGWPDYEMSDFIDTFIFHMLKAAGIKVAHYQVETPEELEAESESVQGNGHDDIALLKAGFDQLNTKFDTLLSVISRAAAQSQGGK